MYSLCVVERSKTAIGTKKLTPPSSTSFIHIEHSYDANTEVIPYQSQKLSWFITTKFSQEIKTFSSFVWTELESVLLLTLKFYEIIHLHQTVWGQIRREHNVTLHKSGSYNFFFKLGS